MDPVIAHADLDPPRQPVVGRGLLPALIAHVLLGMALAASVNWKRTPDPTQVVAVPGLNAPATGESPVAMTQPVGTGATPRPETHAAAGPAAPPPAQAFGAPSASPPADEPVQRSAMGAAPSPAQERVQPSFDCRLARSRVEKMICADPELSRLDRDLGRLHARAKAAAPDPVAFRRQNDAEWRAREQSCRDRECVLAWYAHRREQLLAGLQPSSTR